jgi:hypothetical protein
MKARMLAGGLPVLLLVLICAGPAGAETRTVSFDDLPPETTVADQFRDSAGVFFRGPSQDDGAFPITKTLAPGLPHSGSQVADLSFCFGCELYTPRSIGRLTRTARTVSAFVGYLGSPVGNPPADVTLIARDAGDQPLGSATRTVVQGQPFNQPVTVTAPGLAAEIASFELRAGPPNSNQSVGVDDLAITYPDAPAGPDFALGVSSAPLGVPQGDSVDVPVDLNRLNGSSGDIDLSVSGLPRGMSAMFVPDPVPGADRSAVLRLSAVDNATPQTQYSEITITATPSAGAGPAPRSRTKLVRVVENCERALRTEYLDVRSSGCLRSAGPDILVSRDEPVRINGLQLDPRAGLGRLIINKRKRTVTSDKSVFSVVLADRAAVGLYAGPIDWDLGGSADGPKKVIDFSVDAFKDFYGLKVEKVAVALTKAGKAQVSPMFKLDFWPFNYLGAVTATTAFATDNDSGSDFNTLEVAVDRLAALGIELKDVSVKWKEGSSWSGGATITLRFAKAYSLGAGFGLKDGGFDFLKGSVGGLNAAVSPGVFLQSIGFEVQRNPLSLAGDVGFSAGPQVAGEKAVTVNGGFKAVLDDPFVLELNGKAKLVDRFDLGEAFLRYSSDGLFELGGKVEWDMKVAYASGQVSGFVDGLDAASLEGSVRGCIRIKWAPDPCAGAALIASNIGIAACVDVILGSAGVGYDWGGDFDLWWGDCDLGPWRPARGSSTASASAAAASSRFRLRPGLRSAAFAVEGAGEAPGVTLAGPRGERIAVSRATPSARNGRLFAVQAGNDTTYVVVKRPSSGVWTLTDDGSVPVRRVRQAFGLPEPSAKARVSGRGASRTLSWRLHPIAGQRVRFVEIGAGVRNVIATTRAARGKTRFRPAVGNGRRRRIVALVEQNAAPRASLTAGSYRAPARPRPGRPRRLRIARRARAMRISWRAPQPGFRHAVALRLADGRRLLRIVRPGTRSVTFRRVASGYAARVAITGLTNANGRGPTARATSPGRPKARPGPGGWRLATTFDYVRRGSFTMGRGSVSRLTITPGRVADRACGTRTLRVSGTRRLSPATRDRLAIWSAGSRVTLVQGRKRRRGSLELQFEGRRTAVGELTAKNCRLYFEARRQG